jgi:phosphatidylserine/phosphatidylglycerophosphate/cardiolipin synthase-like enzyme
LLAIASLTASRPSHSRDAGSPVSAEITACFVPAESCVGRIVASIEQARRTIHVQAYGFTSAPILAALGRARERGVEVILILDKSNERGGGGLSRYSGATYAAHHGIPVWIDEPAGIAHNKLILIDGELVIGGSYNFTRAAEQRNVENVLFMRSELLAREFEANWQSRLQASRPYVSPGE